MTKTLLDPHGSWPLAFLLGTPRRAALNELRVNRMLATTAPPLRAPELVGWSQREPSLSFQAVAGSALGPKFPTSLPASEVEALVGLVGSLERWRPRRRWFRRLDLGRRLELHRRRGLISDADVTALGVLAQRCANRWRFAHGDITARNVLRDAWDDLWLIDWEWAGLYPPGYDMAFLWFSLLDVAGARAAVCAAVPEDLTTGFVLSATLIQLLHLHMWAAQPTPFMATHRQTLDELLGEAHDHTSTMRVTGDVCQ